LTLGWMPQGGVVAYDPPRYVDAAGSGLVELGAEVSWGPLFAGGAMMVPIWAESWNSYWPIQLSSTTDVGLEVGPVRIGWRHNCAHPVAPYLPIAWWQEQLVPYFDSAYDLVYVTFRTGGKAR
jgi:hypothetical protein